MDKRETIGKLATELMQKAPESRDPVELQRAMHEDYDKNIYETIARGIKDYVGDFYIVVNTKRERLLSNVLRNYFFARSSCPTPDYDSTVYKYYRSEEALEFLWVVPAKDVCEMYRDHALEVVDAEKELLNYVLEFYDGDLLRKSKKLNGEQVSSNIIEIN